MNWSRGFKRVWLFMLGVIGFAYLVTSFNEGGAFKLGESLVYFLVFAVFWQLLGRAIAWVVSGFSKSN